MVWEEIPLNRVKEALYNLLNAKASTMFAGLGIGYDIMYPANDKIHWERTRTINGGVDVAMFNNRITASIDVYHKLTTELLATKPTDQTLGWESFILISEI